MNATTFAALAEPTRLRIVELLRVEPRSVNQVAESLGLRQPQASKHLRALTEAGLVSVTPQAQQRIYALNPEPFIRLENWADSFQRHWDTTLTNLETYLKKGQP